MRHPNVQPFHHADSGTWSYLVADPAGRQAAIIDPVLDFDPKSGRTATTSAQALLDAVHAAGLQVAWILETHAHADHLSAGHWLRAQLPGAKLAIGEGIRKVQKTFRPIFNLGEHFPVDGSQFDHLFADDEVFPVGAISARVIPVPGHTNDSVAYLVGDALFTGDSLFMPDGGTARCDFPGGDAATLYRSIQRLYSLPDDTRVFVCHDYGPGGREPRCETTIGEQKHGNIHVRLGVDEAQFVKLRTERDATLDMPALILPAVQVNIRAGALPEPEENGVRYLKLPVDAL
ncbi:MBL fold metallo-hydrolase [Arenimonas caeni]|jgi:glyoxylase-like metal-dependent hydrolase (beta-lactamase superfamily II)|uniref:MBL fold metallo-hydrolase n=1 Tax=Arenimonas caeni TaxID=2058085 RepID=A0A2P6MAI6_9GAMM|nr:MBL fold metallo-hydrolase [Arenimonas caeni]MDY0022439.1 MBL fold metallo-hydrolase [Arenimonas caeni]PRH83004.1 MBL fold metallo-hydrolase [Arenimonas caeni]